MAAWQLKYEAAKPIAQQADPDSVFVARAKPKPVNGHARSMSERLADGVSSLAALIKSPHICNGDPKSRLPCLNVMPSTRLEK